MPSPQNFDNLNGLFFTKRSKNRAMSINQFFGEMNLPEEEEKRRIRLAENLEVMMLTFFELVMLYGGVTPDNYDYLSGYLRDLYQQNLLVYVPIDEYLMTKTAVFADEVTRTTQDHADDEWYFSDDRALLIAENESQGTWEYEEFAQAVEAGKTRKTWVAIIDKVTRQWHREVNGKTIPIDDYFHVGNDLMLFSGDMNASDENLANCRCHTVYS